MIIDNVGEREGGSCVLDMRAEPGVVCDARDVGHSRAIGTR